MPISKVQAVKQFFSTPEKPVTAPELLEFFKSDKAGADKIAADCAKALGDTLEVKA